MNHSLANIDNVENQSYKNSQEDTNNPDLTDTLEEKENILTEKQIY